eukprot:TRINITY_DN10551_c0_g1_i1.p1 TRINITY_DN10551_c0_g1~~TRINITY_DN10551_c0_g1_i1.p1  ORF type:complete len:342 (-),score=102.47 TRINITY_DN10551_c0_g1_i1:75-1100(-)
MGAACGKSGAKKGKVDDGAAIPEPNPRNIVKIPSPPARVERVLSGADLNELVDPVPEVDINQQLENRTFDSRYEMKESLGKGSYGTVKVCVEKERDAKYAVKIINMKTINVPFMADVVELEKAGQHPNLIQYHDFFRDEATGMFYVVMEYCEGGDLFTRMKNYGAFDEAMASNMLRQLTSALIFLHSLGIIHRGLKPENVLFASPSSAASGDGAVKIVDYGFSQWLKSDDLLGTVAYHAPEVCSKSPFDKSVDTWALGVIMFVMLVGYHPFDPYGQLSDADLITKITNDGAVKIVDYGFSQWLKSDDLLGTVAYHAPEVCSKSPFDKSVDTWALGVIMFVM